MSAGDDKEYPQLGMQADDSLREMLFHQIEALWPFEREILKRYGLPANATILDVGCGCGEFAKRVAELFPKARVIGVELEERNVKQAEELRQKQPTAVQKRLEFRQGDAYKLAEVVPGLSFDLITCRCMLYAVKQPELIVEQMLRLLKRREGHNTSSSTNSGGSSKPKRGGRGQAQSGGGTLHVLSEDMQGMWYSPQPATAPDFWLHSVSAAFLNTGSNPFMGRDMYPLVRRVLKKVLASSPAVETSAGKTESAGSGCGVSGSAEAEAASSSGGDSKEGGKMTAGGRKRPRGEGDDAVGSARSRRQKTGARSAVETGAGNSGDSSSNGNSEDMDASVSASASSAAAVAEGKQASSAATTTAGGAGGGQESKEADARLDRLLKLDFIMADTTAVPRQTMAGIVRGWRDGYSKMLADHSDGQRYSEQQVRAEFDALINTTLDPQGYFLWALVLCSARL